MPVYHTVAGTVEMLEWGDGAELFVLLHAAAAGPHSLSALAKVLVRPGRRVIAPALDRYGASVMGDGTDRLVAHVDALRACLAIHPAERCVLFGHSMGGLVGLLAAMGGASFDAMVLYEPIVMGCLRADVPDEASLRAWDRAIIADVEQNVTDGNPEAGIAAFVAAWNDVAWSALSSTVRARLIAAAGQLAADMRAVSFHDGAVDRLASIQIPTLLLQGARSPAITHAMSARLQALLPQTRRFVVEGCGHMGPVQTPRAIADCFAAL